MKTILVGEVFRLHGNASIKVSEDASLEFVLAYLGHEQHIRGVFLVDAEQKFKGCDYQFRPQEMGSYRTIRW